MSSTDVSSKAWLLLWRAGLNPSLREEEPSLRSASRRWRQLLHGTESISHRFTTPMDQWSKKLIASRNGGGVHCMRQRGAFMQWLFLEAMTGGREMIERIAEASPRLRARIAGVFYLLTFVTGIFSLVFVSDRLIANFIATACYIVVTLLFYGLFKPANSQLSLQAALFSLVGCVIGVLTPFHLAPFRINSLVFFGVYCLLIG